MGNVHVEPALRNSYSFSSCATSLASHNRCAPGQPPQSWHTRTCTPQPSAKLNQVVHFIKFCGKSRQSKCQAAALRCWWSTRRGIGLLVGNRTATEAVGAVGAAPAVEVWWRRQVLQRRQRLRRQQIMALTLARLLLPAALLGTAAADAAAATTRWYRAETELTVR